MPRPQHTGHTVYSNFDCRYLHFMLPFATAVGKDKASAFPNGF